MSTDRSFRHYTTTGRYISGRRVWLYLNFWRWGACLELGPHEWIVNLGGRGLTSTPGHNGIFRYREGTPAQRRAEKERLRREHYGF